VCCEPFLECRRPVEPHEPELLGAVGIEHTLFKLIEDMGNLRDQSLKGATDNPPL
jgi:hypothetical protein